MSQIHPFHYFNRFFKRDFLTVPGAVERVEVRGSLLHVRVESGVTSGKIIGAIRNAEISSSLSCPIIKRNGDWINILLIR